MAEQKSVAVAKKPNRKPAKNRKTAYDVNKEIMTRVLKENIQWADRVRFPVIRTPEECAERLNFFFDWCAKTGEYPTMEKLYLALGAYPQKIREWENQGTMGYEIAEMLKTARQILAAVDAELAVTNSMPQILYIFRAKNYYGLKDVSTTERLSNIPESVNEKRIAERYNVYDTVSENRLPDESKAAENVKKPE